MGWTPPSQAEVNGYVEFLCTALPLPLVRSMGVLAPLLTIF